MANIDDINAQMAEVDIEAEENEKLFLMMKLSRGQISLNYVC